MASSSTVGELGASAQIRKGACRVLPSCFGGIAALDASGCQLRIQFQQGRFTRSDDDDSGV